MKMTRIWLLWLLSVLLVGCSSPFAPVVLAPTDTITLNSPVELPAEVRSELGSKKIVWQGYPIVLTTGERMGWSSAPEDVIAGRFSNSGRYYVYINHPIEMSERGLPMSGDDTVGIIDFATGVVIPLVSKSQSFPDAAFFYAPTFSPDERSIMFVVYDEHSGSLIRVDIDSRHTQRLNVERRLTQFGWPDVSTKEQIVVICDRVMNNKPISELCLLDENGKFIRYLTDVGYPWPGYGVFTPNGEWVVYESRYKLYKIRVDGGQQQEIAPCALRGPLLVTDNYVVTECVISKEPFCQAVFIASMDGKKFWRLGYMKPLCSEEK